MRCLVNRNPLRKALSTWQSLCAGAPDFEFVQHVLLHGLAVTSPDQRPAPYDVPNHASCRVAVDAAQAGLIVASEQRDGLISTPTAWFMQAQCHWIHPLGLIPKIKPNVMVYQTTNADQLLHLEVQNQDR